MKEEILKIKAEHPELGYKAIAKIVNCAPNTVRYHLDKKVQSYYLIRRSKNRRSSLTKLKEMFGGKCQSCGYNKCLDALCFHHVNPSEKEGSINFFLHKKSWQEAVDEAKKCQLLCSNCHCEEHYRQRQMVR